MDEWNKLHPAVFLDKKDFSTEVCYVQNSLRFISSHLSECNIVHLLSQVIQLDCTHSTGKNPIDNVYFYRKWNLTEAFKIKKYEVPKPLYSDLAFQNFHIWITLIIFFYSFIVRLSDQMTKNPAISPCNYI